MVCVSAYRYLVPLVVLLDCLTITLNEIDMELPPLVQLPPIRCLLKLFGIESIINFIIKPFLALVQLNIHFPILFVRNNILCILWRFFFRSKDSL
jgi:hypothetical protein